MDAGGTTCGSLTASRRQANTREGGFQMHKRIAIAAAAALVACGGGSSWVDPTSGNFTAQDSADVMATISGSFGAAVAMQPGAQPQGRSRAVAVNQPPQACALSGNVTVTGNMDASCSSSTACNFGGQLHLAVNNCSAVTGVVANGGLDIGAS